ncbi:uncharacterized protein LOC144662562 isoform X2 [Oculina patagonica]
MTAFLFNVSRWIVATFVVFGALQQCESFSLIRRPTRVVRVVEGTTINLRWDFTASASQFIVVFSRQKPGGIGAEQIATRSESTAFSYVKASFRTRYDALLPSTLRLKNVTRDEDYVYIFSIFSAFGVERLRSRVTVKVVVPPKITVAPAREPQLNIGQNYTLKCNASGDPHPNITWTKDGVPVNQFNISGPVLHLVNVKRKDAGSYRCTASNGYGDDATSVSIVGIKCRFDCTVKIVGINLRSEEWKSALSNQASVEFKTLESRVLSAIWSVYTKNPAKQLYKVNVDRFRPGSVFAIIELLFGKSAIDTLKPLQDEIKDAKLGSFTVDRTLVVNPMPTTTQPTTTMPSKTTAPKVCIADKYKRCGCYKMLGFCGAGSPFHDLMVKNCNATCGGCKLCIADKYKSCGCYKLLGFCGADSPFHDLMVRNCNATCGECEPPATTMAPSTAPPTTYVGQV